MSLDNQEQEKLEAAYLAEKKKIKRKSENIQEQVYQFHRRNEELVDLVTNLTRDDAHNLRSYYNHMEALEDDLKVTAKKALYKLEEQTETIKKDYYHALDQLEDQVRQYKKRK